MAFITEAKKDLKEAALAYRVTKKMIDIIRKERSDFHILFLLLYKYVLLNLKV